MQFLSPVPTPTDHLSLVLQSSPGINSMLRSFSSIPAKSSIMLLYSAHTLGVGMAKTIIVDDANTDKIVYSKGWTENHGFPWHPDLRDWAGTYVYNSTWHRHVKYRSDDELAETD